MPYLATLHACLPQPVADQARLPFQIFSLIYHKVYLVLNLQLFLTVYELNHVAILTVHYNNPSTGNRWSKRLAWITQDRHIIIHVIRRDVRPVHVSSFLYRQSLHV